MEGQLKKSKAELAGCPQGSLQQEVRNGRTYFFHAQPKEDGKVHRQVVNSSPEIMQGLLRGSYLKCEIAALEQDVRLLQYLQAHFREYSPRELLQKMPKRLQSFSTELFSPQAADAWQEQEYEQSDYKPEAKVHQSSRGLLLRSKSDLAIVESEIKNKLL